MKDRLKEINCYLKLINFHYYKYTFWYYSGFGTKLSPIFGFAKSSQIQNHYSLSQLPKSVVVAVMPSYSVHSNKLIISWSFASLANFLPIAHISDSHLFHSSLFGLLALIKVSILGAIILIL